MKRQLRTIKKRVWVNLHYPEFTSKANEILSSFTDYVALPLGTDSFMKHRDSWGCDKLIIYGWYWLGSADPVKRIVCRYYKPKNK